MRCRNDAEIAEYLSQFAYEGIVPHAPEVSRLLDLTIGRVLRKMSARGEAWAKYQITPTAAHVSDWFSAALENGAAWLSNLDDKGRPKKLMKLGSIRAIHDQADREMARYVRSLAPADLVLGDTDERVVMDVRNGFLMVEMLTPKALDRESSVMRHCIGGGSYDGLLGRADRAFYSLRDAGGQPHVTMLVDPLKRNVLECKGKQNAPPAAKYELPLLDYLRTVDLNWKDFGSGFFSTDEMPFVKGTDGVLEALSHLPETFETAESLTFAAGHGEYLCRHLVCGVLQAWGDGLKYHPETITAERDIELHGEETSARAKSVAGGTVSLTGMSDVSVPSVVRAGDRTWLQNCEWENGPDGVVADNVAVQGSRLGRIAESVVAKNIAISKSELRTWPTADGLDTLKVSNSVLPPMPEGFRVGSLLAFRDTELDRLPDNLAPLRTLALTNTYLPSLPRGTKAEVLILGWQELRSLVIPEECEIDRVAFGHGVDLQTMSWNSLEAAKRGFPDFETAILPFAEFLSARRGIVTRHDAYVEKITRSRI